jgi:hypothetical protein
MYVYAVMCESWNGEVMVTTVDNLYANEAVAEGIVTELMAGVRSSYSPTYWVDPMEVKD